MRFVTLELERYGHFDNCTLSFRSGEPDLHVIYGANEAGKTTSMAAVSDLLFGFPGRSPYNFLYDYSLLRVGAVLEDAGQTMSCRRKKSPNGSLLGPDDKPIDEGRLLAMLRGQTRETFGLSFSLDQDGLRAGGKAMVEARNDLGRALFAAGSGLTGVSDELACLEEEADAIWGPRASSKRSFTVAQRELETNARAIRERSLRPKIWLDGRAAVATAQAALDDAQRRRDELLAEISRAERIRRIAPSARLRTDHLTVLSEYSATVDIPAQRENIAEAAMADAAIATRAKAVAAKLAVEATERMKALVADTTILAHADLIDELVTASGAVVKAGSDMVRLTTEQATRAGRIERLREEAGALAADPPSRIASAKLRELALAQVEDQSAVSQIAESEQELEERRRAAPGTTPTIEAVSPNELETVFAAVDAARALGADIDARCQTLRRTADSAATMLAQALVRLAPWNGDATSLLQLPRIGQLEVDEARETLFELTTKIDRELATVARFREEAASLSLQMEQLASGKAVSADEIANARIARDERWRPLRDHVLSKSRLDAPNEAVSAFETTLAQADERSDLRFAAADESSRLTDMANRAAKLLLDADHADIRAETFTGRREAARTAWGEKLTAAGHPDMEPIRFLAWSTERAAAEAAHAASVAAAEDADVTIARRATALEGLAACLPEGDAARAGVEIAAALSSAERLRTDLEIAEQQRRLDEAEAARIRQDAEALGRRRKRLEDAASTRIDQWRQELEQAGLSLEIDNAIATLDVLDELRVEMAAQSDLNGRLDGMVRDNGEHDDRVVTVADALDIPPAKDSGDRLALIRTRLTAARSTATVLDTLQATVSSRDGEMAAEDAKLKAALDSLAVLMEETGSADIDELTGAIERSRAARALRASVADTETAIKSAGDGKGLEELLASLEGVDPDGLAAKTQTLSSELAELNAEVDAAATTQGDARRSFASLEQEGDSAIDAATDADHARAELAVLSEQYILKRAEAVMLRWAIEQYRERHQDPMLLRASDLFSTLTIGRYAALRIDNDADTPRLLGIRDDGRTVVEVGGMSEGTTDQLFLALRLAAVEQSVAAGIRLPFLADDLFVNFDDERSEAGFRVLAELAKSTQVLFFTHHPHLASIARSVVGAEVHSECSLA
jgi:uncharacterized protein YhaN